MPQAERKHCFEIILSDGSTVQLCASSESELQSWLQSLCEAVADGIAVGVAVILQFGSYSISR